MKTKKAKDAPVSAGEVISFKVPDQQFADIFNLGMKATGALKAVLAVQSVRAGLKSAVWTLSEGRQEALERFQSEILKPAPSKGLPADRAASTALTAAARKAPTAIVGAMRQRAHQLEKPAGAK